MVNSVNTNKQAEYQKKFSLCKAATSAAIGATGLKVAKDLSLRYQAKNVLKNYTNNHFLVSDQFITEATQNAKNICEEASNTLTKTEYLTKIKEYAKSPLTAIKKTQEYITTKAKNFDYKNAPSKVKTFTDNALSKVKSLKGETIKDTAKNIMEATKTAKGQKALTLITGALCGILLLGSSKIVKKEPENQA